MVYQNGKQVGMSMALNDWPSGSDIYSMEEKVIGQWINGKPLYRRTIPFTTAGLSIRKDIITISELQADQVVRINGFVNGDEGRVNLLNAVACDEKGVSWAIWTSVFKGAVATTIYNATTIINKPAVLIVDYTKTTDQATIELPATLSTNSAISNANNIVFAPASSAKDLTTNILNKELET